MLFADLLSLHLVTFLMFFILVMLCPYLGGSTIGGFTPRQEVLGHNKQLPTRPESRSPVRWTCI